MTVVAASRAAEIDVPLFLHVAGAMILVGLLVAAALGLVLGWRAGDAQTAVPLTRFGLLTLMAAFPAWVLMRVGAQWTYSRAGWEDAPEEPSWLGIGYVTADLGGVLLLVSLVVGVVTLRRLRGADAVPRLARVAAAIAVLLSLAYVVAIWAMTAKPD